MAFNTKFQYTESVQCIRPPTNRHTVPDLGLVQNVQRQTTELQCTGGVQNVTKRSDQPRPRIPSRADFYVRTQTFKNWPRSIGVKVSDLVNSGFSYSGTSDRVQCFHCGKILECWRGGENVDIKHEQSSPKCTFIKTKLERTLPSMEPAAVLHQQREFRVTVSEEKSVSPKERGHVEPVRRLDYSHVLEAPQYAPRNFSVAPRDIRARLDTASSRKLLDMGFKKTLLAQVIGERLAETGNDFSSFMETFLAVKNAEQMLSGGGVNTMKSHYDRSVLRLSNPASLVEREEPEPAASATPSPPVSPPAPSGTDNSPKRKKECNICMDAEADTVFMSCRHMCSCSTCADKMENCPICRKPIEYCIRVYV